MDSINKPGWIICEPCMGTGKVVKLFSVSGSLEYTRCYKCFGIGTVPIDKEIKKWGKLDDK